MAARQEDVNGAMLSILKKMDSMVSATQESYEESLITLGSVENIMKVDVGSELKKQTSLLSSIEAKLISGLETSTGDGSELKDQTSLLSSIEARLTSSLEASAGGGSGAETKQLIDAIGNVENVMKVEVGSELKNLTSLLSSIEEKLISSLEASANASKGADEFDSKGVDAMSTSLIKMSKAAKLVSEKAGEKVKKFLGNIAEGFADLQEKIDEKKAKEISNLIKTLAGSVLYFAGAMILATPFLVLSLLGSALLGLNIKILSKAAGDGLTLEKAEGMAAIISVGGKAFMYALSMVAVTLLAPFMILGAIVLAKSITLL